MNIGSSGGHIHDCPLGSAAQWLHGPLLWNYLMVVHLVLSRKELLFKKILFIGIQIFPRLYFFITSKRGHPKVWNAPK